MLYNRCTGIYKFGNNTYPRRIRRRSNLRHFFGKKKCDLRAGKYGICFGDAAAYLVYVVSLAGWSVYWPLCAHTIASRPTSLQGIQHTHIHKICCRITETYNIAINFVTYKFSKEHCLLPEDDLMIETCRSVLNVLV